MIGPYGGVEIQQHSLLTFVVDELKWLDLHSGRFTTGKNPVVHCIRGWVGPRASFNFWKYIKNPYTCRESKHISFVFQFVA